MNSEEKLEPEVTEVLLVLNGKKKAFTSCPRLLKQYTRHDPTPVEVMVHGKMSGRFFYSIDFGDAYYFESCVDHLQRFLVSHEEVSFD